MKKITAAVAIIMAIGFSGCKKAEDAAVPTYYCKNTCYLCYQSSNYKNTHSLCNTDFTEEQFQEYLFIDSLTGFICKEVAPAILHEISGENINAQIDSEEVNRLTCYNKEGFNPQYFDYNAFAERNDRCNKCYDTIGKHYLEIYFDTIDHYIGGFSECAECDVLTFARDTAAPYAIEKINAMGMHCGLPNSPLATLPYFLSHLLPRLRFESVCDTCLVHTYDEKDYWIRLGSWVDFNPSSSVGLDFPPIFRECP